MGNLPVDFQAVLAERYIVEGELGSGGMATVYRARDLKHHRVVAIKVLRRELAAAIGPERFLREIKIAAQLNHPHILPLFDSGEAAGLLYYVMPLVEGESLRERLEREKQLPIDDALVITRAVAGALSYAHRSGIFHRDIKPANILLSQGEAVVADFGIARATSGATGRITETGLAIGTPAYMSPEQASGTDELDGRSDLYSLGCVLYEMLAGAPPFSGPTAQSLLHQHMTVPARPVRALRATVPLHVEQAIERSLAKAPADRFAGVAQFTEALSGAGTRPPRLPQRTRRWIAAVALTAALAAAAIRLGPWRTETSVLDADLIAVAPFDVFSPALELWREGLMDILSRSLDGAGPLRTVSPSLVMQRWTGRADPASARELGRKSGARLVLFGQLRAAGDSAQLTATLLDAATGDPVVSEIALRELSADADRLADSLTVTVLRELGRTRPLGAVRSGSLGSASLPAIKAFLRGEQLYRRRAWDSARTHYERAIAIDSFFALALRRQSLVNEDEIAYYRLRAGAHNHGLPPRDSMLVLVDSLDGALRAVVVGWPLLQRLFATLDTAVRRYPADPEVWERMGDMSYHWAWGPSPRTALQALEAFDRAIALDSGFVPAYTHTVELALPLRGPVAARRYVSPLLALGSDPFLVQSLRLTDALLNPASARSAQVARMLDTLSADALYKTFYDVRSWPDSDETGIRVARALSAALHRRDSAEPSAPPPAVLAHRGHVREAYQSLGREFGWRFSYWELAIVGAIPAASASAMFHEWLRDRERWSERSWWGFFAGAVSGWWASLGDTASIQELAGRADSTARSTITRASTGSG
jgi:serine/threonine-protein kinase